MKTKIHYFPIIQDLWHVIQRNPYTILLPRIPYTPHALPLAVGIVALVWGTTELRSVIAATAPKVWDLYLPLAPILVGTVFLVFGGVGAIAVAIRHTEEPGE